MRARLAGMIATLVAASVAAAHAEPGQDRIRTERAAASAALADRERECTGRFVVAPCLESARKENRATLARLRQQELQLDDDRRHAAAEARRKSIADKAQSQRARASDEAPAEPRARAPHPSHPLEPKPPHSPPRPHAPLRPETPAARPRPGVDEPQNAAKFEARSRAIDAHRDAVERRNADRAAHGKVATPLPLPSDAASSVR